MTPDRPGIVHRIDKGTSGLLVVAKSLKAYYGLAAQFKEHTVSRKYVALIHGNPEQSEGTIVAPIGRSRRDRKKMAVTLVNSRDAITLFSIVERFKGYSFAEVRLKTGRTHQIRVHFSYIGYPVVGDPVYGGRRREPGTSATEALRDALQGLSRQALHAKSLGFVHPVTGSYLEFSSEIPEDIQNVIDALKSA